VEEAHGCRRSSHRPEGCEVDDPDDRRRGDHRRLSAAHAAATGRLSVRPAGHDPAPDAIALHRCLQRHGISRLPEVTGDKEPKKKFKAYPIGYFHIDIAEVRTAEGKLYLYVAIDRTSKFAFVQLVTKTGRTSASAFLVALIGAVPYKIHTVLTDNGIQFTFPPRYADGPTARYITHTFDMRCCENGIEHRLTKIKHPWTNGQVERMNRTIKEATVKRYHYDSHRQLETHLHDFIDAYNYGRRLKTLKGLTPFEYICKIWTSEPERFTLDPTHQMPGLNT
jgi:transposase InsO family protein